MAANADTETVADILARKKGSVRQAPLEAGSPSWEEIQGLTWAEIKDRARKRVTGYKTFRKLLSDSEYDR